MKHVTSGKLKLIYLGLCLVVIALIAGFILNTKPSEPVNHTVPEDMQASFMMPDEYVYRQDDTLWAADTIGDTSDTLYAYGCTVASVAMAVLQYEP